MRRGCPCDTSSSREICSDSGLRRSSLAQDCLITLRLCDAVCLLCRYGREARCIPMKTWLPAWWAGKLGIDATQHPYDTDYGFLGSSWLSLCCSSAYIGWGCLGVPGGMQQPAQGVVRHSKLDQLQPIVSVRRLLPQHTRGSLLRMTLLISL
jgi:hypothetical protein